MLVADFGSGQALWSIFWFFLFFIWIMILFRVFADLFMSKELSGFAKVMWCLFVILHALSRGVRVPDRSGRRHGPARR